MIGHASNAKGIHVPRNGARTVSYAYDAGSGDLATVSDWTGGAPAAFDFNGAGSLAETRRPNGITTNYGYDAALRLTGISHIDTSTSTALAEYGYQYDANGNRTRLDVTGSAVTNGYELYGYDELGRLTSVRNLDASEVAFGFDPNGNLTSIAEVGGSTISFGYDAADQMQMVDSVDLFDYDGNGNRISHGSDTYSWDWANRLTGASVQGTGVAFSYLGDNTRASKTVDSTTTTGYQWDRVSGLPKMIDDGTTSAVAGTLTEIDNATNARTWDLADGLGSVRAASNDSGTITDTADWDVWGETTNSASGIFGWTGEQSDAETGLTYLRSRYYSPVYGRFLSTDPISPNGSGTQGYNPYAYPQNNPATRTDPSRMLPGLGGLGSAIASVFAYLASVFECFLSGECRYQREHGGGGIDLTRGTGGGGTGTGTGIATVWSAPSVCRPTTASTCFATRMLFDESKPPSVEWAPSLCAFGRECDRFRPTLDNETGPDCFGLSGEASQLWGPGTAGSFQYYDACDIVEMLEDDGLLDKITASADFVDQATDSVAGHVPPAVWIAGKTYVISVNLLSQLISSSHADIYMRNCKGKGVVKFEVTEWAVANWEEMRGQAGDSFIPYGEFTDKDLYYKAGWKVRPQDGTRGGYASCDIGPPAP